MGYFPLNFPHQFNQILQVDIINVMQTILLSFSDITDYVEQRVFKFQIPQDFVGTDCIVISDSINTGSEKNGPITKLSVQISSFSLDVQTSRDINRIGIFPNIQQYTDQVFNDGTGSFGNDYRIEILQEQSPITIIDSDYVKEYWQTIVEYEVTLRW